jgi:hypothetical protein
MVAALASGRARWLAETVSAAMLDAPSDVGVGAGLSVVLSRVEGHEAASAVVRRYLAVSVRWGFPNGHPQKGPTATSL